MADPGGKEGTSRLGLGPARVAGSHPQWPALGTTSPRVRLQRYARRPGESLAVRGFCPAAERQAGIRSSARYRAFRRAQEFRKASTASTLRLSSVDGARSSLAKMLVLCFPTAFSEVNSRWGIA